ncbi:MAG: capsule biosynthesis protein [Deltaproteobacteria bacterium]|nr:capsule biosynthesis protein [Deltaproteobacteria bacterium]
MVVQELGGFLSNIATFHVARSLGIDNIFLEPSFFRGRLFFVRNSFAAPIVRETGGAGDADTKEKVRKYLDDAVARQSIVIPSKDTHHYRKPLRKLTDAGNWRRLLEKTGDKFIRGKREEFDHLGGHVLRHLRMAVNSQLLKPHYRALPAGERFIYYPLHVPADVALTLRSPEYLDQLALIDFIARCVPHPWKVAVKEHPALVGAVDYRRVRQLLARRDNVILIDPGTNNYEVIRQAGAVITVNSKSGAEALLVGTPVVVLGDAFYRGCRLAHVVDRLHDLPELMGRILRESRIADHDAARAFFTDVWTQSFPGELYDATPRNVTEITASLRTYLALAPGRAP